MKAIIYSRFSDRPNAAECESISAQVERCRAYCTSQGYEIVGEFDDKAISGKSADNRPGLQAAIDSACGLKAIIVSYSLSRVARNTIDALAIADRLHKAGAGLALLDLQLDSNSPMGRMMFTILAAFAQLERETISKRTSDCMQTYQRQGRRMSRYAPYGWRLDDDGTLIRDVDEQAVLSSLKSWRSLAEGSADIAKGLNRDGLLYRGRAWKASDVKRILDRA